MRHDRHSSLLRRLVAEHHVYVRSDATSRYVVLRWPWQVGVSLALVAVAVWAGLASLGWLAAYLEALDQRRELARLAQANQRLEALAAAYVMEEASPPPTGVHSLVAELHEVKVGGPRGFYLSDAAAAAAEEPWRAPIADGWLAERLLPAAMHVNASGSGRDWLYDRITRQPAADPARAAETIRLRTELRSARAEIARLENALDEARDSAADR
ncbi:MAG: LapA family protein [Geminicoccaceae bacterium]